MTEQKQKHRETGKFPRQFVVLEHLTDPVHFDVMLEREEILWTWAYYDETFPAIFQELSLERIQDHRKKYLTYEGPISGDRGKVRRVESGNYQLQLNEAGTKKGRFQGEQWSFFFHLIRTGENGLRGNPTWILRNLGTDQ